LVVDLPAASTLVTKDALMLRSSRSAPVQPLPKIQVPRTRSEKSAPPAAVPLIL
jgi:hypothetical protein